MLEPVPVGVRFTHWVRRVDGRWDEITVAVQSGTLALQPVATLEDVRRHYRRALARGGGAPARLGLALVAREEGRQVEADRHLAAACELEAEIPALGAAAAARGASPPRDHRE